DAVPAVTSATGGSTAPSADDGGKDVARTQDERGFLDELSRLGLPVRTAADTTVEVGNGICRTLDEGVDTVAILDGIRPISSALAAQSGERDAQEAGRALVDASRTHLCGERASGGGDDQHVARRTSRGVRGYGSGQASGERGGTRVAAHAQVGLDRAGQLDERLHRGALDGACLDVRRAGALGPFAGRAHDAAGRVVPADLIGVVSELVRR